MCLFTVERMVILGGSVLYEVQAEKGNERYKTLYDEEWQGGDAGRLSNVRNQNVQDWKERLAASCGKPEKVGGTRQFRHFFMFGRTEVLRVSADN